MAKSGAIKSIVTKKIIYAVLLSCFTSAAKAKKGGLTPPPPVINYNILHSFKKKLNPQGFQNCVIGLKVTALLPDRWILQLRSMRLSCLVIFKSRCQNQSKFSPGILQLKQTIFLLLDNVFSAILLSLFKVSSSSSPEEF